MAVSDERGVAISGMTEGEAKEFHRIFMTSFIVFTLVAIVAHFLAWEWRPWLPSAQGYTMLDSAKDAANHVLSMVG